MKEEFIDVAIDDLVQFLSMSIASLCRVVIDLGAEVDRSTPASKATSDSLGHCCVLDRGARTRGAMTRGGAPAAGSDCFGEFVTDDTGVSSGRA